MGFLSNLETRAGLIVSPATILVRFLHGSNTATWLTHLPKIYDYLITFEREVVLVWRSPWSAIKILFFVTRYAPVFGVSAALYRTLHFEVPPRLERLKPLSDYFVPATSASGCRTAILVSQCTNPVDVRRPVRTLMLFYRGIHRWSYCIGRCATSSVAASSGSLC